MKVYATPETITAKFIVKSCIDKIKENTRLVKLLNYYSGQQDILQRYYEDPTKPNNKIVVNFCKNIADFFADYVVGKPVTYKNAEENLLNVLKENNADNTTLETVLNMNIYGFACELLYTDEQGETRFKTIDSEESIIVFNSDLDEEIIGFIRLVKQDEESIYSVDVYSNSSVHSYTLDSSSEELTANGKEQQHYFGIVPIAYYQNNKSSQGSFEQVLSMQDALNKIVSDNVNDFEQFVDSYLVIEGMQATTSDDIAQMKQNRAILTDKDSKVYWLTKQVNNAHIKTLQDDLERFILDTCSMPNINDLKTAQSISGEAIKMRFKKTDIVADGQERAIKQGLQRRLLGLSNILNITGTSTINNIEIAFTRNIVLSQENRAILMSSLHSTGAVSTAELRQTIFDEPLEVAESKVEQIRKDQPTIQNTFGV